MKLTEVCNKLREINKSISELSQYHNSDLYHNHLYKEFFIAECIMEYDSTFHSFVVNGKKSPKGHDFKNSLTENGESKSSASCKTSSSHPGKMLIGRCNFEFDKQDDKARRKKILSVGAYAFGYFDKKVLIMIQYINTPEGVVWMNEKIKQKQLDKMHIIQECKAKNIQIPRDTIVFNGTELLNCPGSVYLDSVGSIIPNIMDVAHIGKGKTNGSLE